MSTEKLHMLGFIKQASEYGYTEKEAEHLYKQAYGVPSNFVPNTPGSLAAPMGNNIPESVRPEYQSNPNTGMLSGSNFYSSPTPAQARAAAPSATAPAPASAPAPAPAQAGPSNAQLAKIMGSYNPNSRLDQAKASRIRELYGQGTTSPNAIYADKGYSSINPRSIRAAAPQARPVTIPTKTANMNTQQQAYIYGFVKRASEYGYSEQEAINILKAATELKGDQHKLDVDHDGKIEASDLKKLRQRKQAGFFGDLANRAGTAYNDYVNQKNTPTPADIEANKRARANYTKQMQRPPVAPQPAPAPAK
jgi:hypothetical protein